MKDIWNKKFWKCALERAIRTSCQVFATNTVGVVILSDVNWKFIFSTMIMGAITSIVTSVLLGIPEAKEGEK